MMPEKGKKKVAVIGLKDTGYLSSLFLQDQGYEVFATDLSEQADVRQNVEKLRQKRLDAECGRHSFDKILLADWALVSPGIPPSSQIYQKLRSAGKRIYSEIEVASWFSSAKTVVAVTGSCGKTTTATLIAKMLEASGRNVVLCGNIGNPWIGEIAAITEDAVVVLELSSFQLMHCESFAPSVGLLLNIYPNHMDWHQNMKEYAAAKLNLFRFMKASDVMICRRIDEENFFKDFKSKAKRIYFDQRMASDPNEAALLCAADALSCSPECAHEVFKNFQGIEHRLERFAEWKGISFVNDSKSTTPASLLWALSKYPDRRVVLIAGGHAKSEDFSDLKSVVRQKVKCAILIGEAKEMIRKSWEGAAEMHEALSFDEACAAAIARAQSGDVVLLSTACASFDMFKNYQERGRIFKQIIRKGLETRDPRLETKTQRADTHA